MTLRECYAALELPHGASWEDVRKAHKLLATVWHPDRFTASPTLRDQAEAKLKTINEAYATLKAHFDSGGKVGSTADSAASGAASDEIYIDREVRYHGGDDRLRPVGFMKRPAMVRVGPEGITLGTLVGQDLDEVIHYPAETIRVLDVQFNIFGTPGTDFGERWQQSIQPNYDLRSDAVRLDVSDPESLRSGFQATLSFRNDYYCQVFQKRVRERFCPRSWEEFRRLTRERERAEEQRRQEEERKKAEEEAKRRQEEHRRRTEAEQRRAEEEKKRRKEYRAKHPVWYWLRTVGPTIAVFVLIPGFLYLMAAIGSRPSTRTPAQQVPEAPVQPVVDPPVPVAPTNVAPDAPPEVTLTPSMSSTARSRREFRPASDRSPNRSSRSTRTTARRYRPRRLGSNAVSKTRKNSVSREDFAEAQRLTDQGYELHMEGDYRAAVTAYERALKLNPDSIRANNNLAWLRATCPDASYRDGKLALELARKSMRLGEAAGQPKYLYYGTLAAAHAECGKFDQAVIQQQRCINAAPPEHIAAARERLGLYERQQPYRGHLE